MVCHPVTALADITLTHLQRLVGRTFLTSDAGGRRVDLKLVGVTDMRPRLGWTPDPGPAVTDRDGVLEVMSPLDQGPLVDPLATRPFALLFLGPERHPLSEGRYDLELPWLPLEGLHLTPLGSSQVAQRNGLLYEAVVD
jgi:hypothetical protein